jgi:hypothetical protein
MPRRCLVYAGPTLHRARAMSPLRLDDVVVLPPVARGDVDRAVRAAATPGVLVVVDGVFHLQSLAVGHLELRDAIAAGWTVWGLSSMGAIRAAEMEGEGMRGFGRAYARYRDDPDFRDDEVALLHEPTPPYRELSEPLLHLRSFLDGLVSDGRISAGEGRRVVEHLEGLWFGERTVGLVKALLGPGRDPETVAGWFADFDRHRIKAIDLIEFFKTAPWRGT